MAKKCGNCSKCRKAQASEHKEKECHTECNTAVDLHVDVDPKVRHTQSAHRKTSFDVCLDFKTEPRCCLKKKCVKRTGRCSHKAVFEVEVDLDLECHSKVSRPHSPRATFDLDVDIDTETHAHAKGTCHKEASEHEQSEF